MIVKELCYKNIIDLCFSLGFESYYYFARNIEKKIYCWGCNDFGQLGNSKREEIVKPELNELLSDLNIIDIKCGANHSIGLT
jgi:alpha-tubulin suppressor-like RCC1 family protein